MRVALLFIDGVGVGARAPHNPLHGRRWLLSQFDDGSGEPLPLGGVKALLDPTSGIPGRPQSATNQTALYTGVDAPRVVGRHVLGYPTAQLRSILAERSIFRRLSAAGRRVTFANAYPAPYLAALGLPYGERSSGAVSEAARREVRGAMHAQVGASRSEIPGAELAAVRREVPGAAHPYVEAARRSGIAPAVHPQVEASRSESPGAEHPRLGEATPEDPGSVEGGETPQDVSGALLADAVGATHEDVPGARPLVDERVEVPAAVRRRLRPSASTLALAAAGGRFRTFADAHDGRGLTHDITGAAARSRGFDVPEVSPEEAARRFWALAEELTLFEHFLADVAGHAMDAAGAEDALATFDAFARAVVASRPADAAVIITSDHGNVEDLSTRNHTLNAVAMLGFGLPPRPAPASLAELGERIISLVEDAP